MAPKQATLGYVKSSQTTLGWDDTIGPVQEDRRLGVLTDCAVTSSENRMAKP